MLCCCRQVTVVNNLPPDWPSVSKGISVHWHGFSLRANPWMDGTKYISQCPIPAGSNFTYKFQVSQQHTLQGSWQGSPPCLHSAAASQWCLLAVPQRSLLERHFCVIFVELLLCAMTSLAPCPLTQQ